MTTPRDPYIGKRRKGTARAILHVLALIVGFALLVWLVTAVVSCRGTQTMRKDEEPAVLASLQRCIRDSLGIVSTAVEAETLEHLVNGGVHEVSVDSMHKILGDNQTVEAVTHTEIDSTARDTVVTIYLRAPLKDVFTHELANALVARHRAVLLGSEPVAQTSTFYKRCVGYCPHCTGAY